MNFSCLDLNFVFIIICVIFMYFNFIINNMEIMIVFYGFFED